MDENGGFNQLRLEAGDLLTVEELANLLRLSPSGVMRLKDREGLPAYHVGNRWLFDRREVAMWLAPRRIDVTKH
jgi:excisionase family DNA binding protein